MSTTSTVITVTQLTAAIKNQLESRFVNLTVQGEMSNCKLHSSGHLYFDLKDSGAKVPAVLFRAKESKLSRMPKEGDHVIITGAISVYPPHGKYQIIARRIEYQGVGELLMRLEALKKKLSERGWFDKDKKRALPKFPRRIGVVTSPTGAVIRDIIHVLSRRYAGFQLILNPVRVQGNEAAYEIAEAIEQFNAHNLCDVMIVGRGGGSLEDLWPFNEEIVAKAIFESRIPIVSAVGHETDVTIADFVADVRAPTPSAAAEIVSAEKQQHVKFLETMQGHLSHALLHQVKRYRATLNGYARHPLFSTSYALLGGPLQRIDELKTRLDGLMRQELARRRYLLAGREKQTHALKPTNQLVLCQSKLASQVKHLDQAMKNKLAANKQKLKEIIQQFSALDPKNVLKRGYSILFALNEGSVIVSSRELTPGQKLEALFSDGRVKVSVDNE